jgi:hypothetical protein
MTEDKSHKESLTDQIMSELFQTIGQCDEFDDDLMKTLQQLYADGNMKKTPLIIEAIKPKTEVKLEDS